MKEQGGQTANPKWNGTKTVKKQGVQNLIRGEPRGGGAPVANKSKNK